MMCVELKKIKFIKLQQNHINLINRNIKQHSIQLNLYNKYSVDSCARKKNSLSNYQQSLNRYTYLINVERKKFNDTSNNWLNDQQTCQKGANRWLASIINWNHTNFVAESFSINLDVRSEWNSISFSVSSKFNAR